MAKQKIDNVYIADGLAEDCEELILKCSQVSKLSFEKFGDIWREMNFSSIFHGRPSGAELAEFSEEALHIAKFFMVSNIHNNFEKSVAGLFLVYGILNLQPYPELASVRLVQDDVPAIEKLEYTARRERRHDILYILGEVLIRGPCQFHVSVRERGLDFCLRKYFDGYTQHSTVGKRPIGVFHRHNEELDIIRELSYLEDRYEKAKKKITGPEPDRSLSYANSRLAKDLQVSLKTVVSGIVVQDANNKTETKEKPLDHYESVQAIKNMAMKTLVNPIKHLHGVQDRNKNLEESLKKKPKKSKEYMKLLETPTKTTPSRKSPIKSPKPYPWSLKVFNEFEENIPSTSNHKPYKNIARTSPRKGKPSTAETPTSDRGMMIIDLEPIAPPNTTDNKPNPSKKSLRRSPRKKTTPKRRRIDRMLSFDESSDDEPPIKKNAPKRGSKKQSDTENITCISDNDSPYAELRIEEIPIEFSNEGNEVEIEIIDLYKSKDDKQTIKLKDGNNCEAKTCSKSPKILSNAKNPEIMKNEPSTSRIIKNAHINAKELSQNLNNNIKHSEITTNTLPTVRNNKNIEVKTNKTSQRTEANIIKSSKSRKKMIEAIETSSRNEVDGKPTNKKNKGVEGTKNKTSPINEVQGIAKEPRSNSKLKITAKNEDRPSKNKRVEGTTSSRNEVEVNEPSTSNTKQINILKKNMKLTKIKSRIKKLGIGEVVDFESAESSD